MDLLLIIITALSYGYVLGRLHERIEAAEYGARCERDSLGWWLRKPEYRDLYHIDQDGIEPSDFKPLQGEAMRAHFGVKTPRMDFRAPVLRRPIRWKDNTA
jgi:hypothetical protein